MNPMSDIGNCKSQIPNRKFILLSGLIIFLCGNALPTLGAGSPLSPAEEQASFQLADPSLSIELVAAEPDIVSPVALAWDSAGRLFVAEMTDYPSGPVSGRIKMLEDAHGTGRYDRVTEFAGPLAFPNGVMPWKDGILVTAAPDVWFLRDRDGDGRADDKKVVLTGFAEGNQQLRVNGLFWGLDNWIYGANGRSDGEVRWAEQILPATAAARADETISIRRRDFRFQPEARRFQAVAGNSQFGTAHDDWGHRFPVFNNIPVRQVVVEDYYLEGLPGFLIPETVINLAPPGDDGRVFPICPPVLLIPQPVGFFTSACGPAIYRDDRLGSEYRGNVFICEATQNLVTRRQLSPQGAAFTAQRPYSDREFLASRDSWFHPVFLATGPDGALYVVDFYRQYVEHPHWVAESLRPVIEWRKGENHGRIWRIRGRGPLRPRASFLAGATTAQLVQALNDANGWWRDTAQRLLVERRDRAAIAPLESLVANRKDPLPFGRLHALHTLAGMGALSPGILAVSLADPVPGIREHAVKLAELFLPVRSSIRAAGAGAGAPSPQPGSDSAAGWTPALVQAVARLAGDPNDRVRFQVGCTLGQLALSSDQALALWRRLAEPRPDRWQGLALLLSAGANGGQSLETLLDRPPSWLEALDAETADFLEKLGALTGSRAGDGAARQAAERVGARAGAARWLVLGGLARGLEESKRSLRTIVESGAGSRSNRSSSSELIEQWSSAAFAEAAAPAQPDLARAAAIALLGKIADRSQASRLLPFLAPETSPRLQAASARAVAELEDPPAITALFASWPRRSRAAQKAILASVPRSRAMAEGLVTALEQRVVHPNELDPPLRQRLLKSENSSLKTRAEKVMQPAVNPDRQAVIDKFTPALNLTGVPEHGGALFAKNCLVCHSIAGQGSRVGPDLSGIGAHAPESLLADILDPDRQILPDYMNYTVSLPGGESISGMIAAETATTLTLRRAGEADRTVLRAQIKEVKAEGKSPMPEGLEQAWSLQDFADLLAFLRDPKPRWLQP